MRRRIARRHDLLVEVVDALHQLVEIGAGDADIARARRELDGVNDAGMEDAGIAGVQLVRLDLLQVGRTVLLVALGAILAPPHLDIGVADRLAVDRPGGAVIVRCPAVGWRLRVPVKASLDQAATAEIVIRKGEMVECVSDGQGFAVSTTMMALEDAAVGQPVRVKSLTSSTTMTAYVKTRGVVTF